jgi:hypothetical protein
MALLERGSGWTWKRRAVAAPALAEAPASEVRRAA